MRLFITLSILILTACATQPAKKHLSNESGDLNKEKSQLYFSIAKSYEQNARFEEAIENYQEALEIDARNTKAHFFLGRLLLKKNFIEKGLSHLNRAILFDKDYAEAKNFLARYYFSKNQLGKAKKLVDETAENLAYSNQEETWSLKLKVDHKLLGKKALITTVPKVLGLSAKSCEYRLEIASSLYKMKVYGKALESARLAGDLCQTTRERNQAALLKGLVFIKKNNPLVAEKILKDISPESESFKKILSRVQTVVRKKINTGI